MDVKTTSTDFSTRKIGNGKFEVSTQIDRKDAVGTEQILVRVMVDDADKLTGAQIHTAALKRARQIIDDLLG